MSPRGRAQTGAGIRRGLPSENPQGLYRRPAIDFPRELPRFCPQISLQNVYLMTPSNGVVEGEGTQIRLWPSGQPTGSNSANRVRWDYFRFPVIRTGQATHAGSIAT
jgi:hypothetical protein